jgi:ferrous iron transport protein B
MNDKTPKNNLKNEEENKPNSKVLKKSVKIPEKTFSIALAGNPNVGKSVIFNQLTGLSQVVGNWPGKTVSKAEGKTKFQNYLFNIIDLPGIYSLSTYSLEEIISREYILQDEPDYIINVLDSNQLERNLFFTLQLLMLGRPVIISLNQFDLLQKRGYEIDCDKLSELLGVPVIPTVAVHNRGVHELLEKIIEVEERSEKIVHSQIPFGKEIESKVQEIIDKILKNKNLCKCPTRFMAIKLLEKDKFCLQGVTEVEVPNLPSEYSHVEAPNDDILPVVNRIREELEDLHGESISTILNAEFYNIASQIDEKVISIKTPTKKLKWQIWMDHITLHSFWGYIVLFFIMMGAYSLVFIFGDLISGWLDALFTLWTPGAESQLGGSDSLTFKIVWNALVGGLFAGIGGVLPYVIPFYFIIEILQDTGYLPRAAYLMDRLMHNLGVHGKTIIPILLGFGCNVPAISACSIMETEKEKKRAILISSMIPCSAVTTIVLGLVAKHLGFGYALLVYAINFGIIIIIGKFMKKMGPEEESELIIELHNFRKPNAKVIATQTWQRSREFVYMALPLIVILGIFLQLMMEFNILAPINNVLSPLTVTILGLPIGVGVYLFYGVLRKELNLVLLEIYVLGLGLTMNQYMTPIQMIIFCLVTMLYVPCLATIIVIKKEAGGKFATQVFFFEIILAVIIAGGINWGYKLITGLT